MQKGRISGPGGGGSARPEAAAALRALTEFQGKPAIFWRDFLDAAMTVTGANSAALWIQGGNGGPWRVALGRPDPEGVAASSAVANHLATAAPEDGQVVVLETGRPLALLRLRGGDSAALVALEGASGADGSDLLALLQLASAAPEGAEWRRKWDGARRDAERFAIVLDLLLLIARERKFVSAAMMLCNEMSTRLACDRVSLGWIEGNTIQVRAISHTEKIEKRMEAVDTLASAMEESADQVDEVLVPKPEGAVFLDREHLRYAQLAKMRAIASFPLFGGPEEKAAEERVVGVLTVERSAGDFQPAELATIRLLIEQVARPLQAIREEDRWWGSRLSAYARKRASGLLGVEHTFLKMLGILLALGFLVLVFGRKEYRIQSNFTVRTDSMSHLTAPFNGHLESSAVRVGDEVKNGAALFTLDTREIKLQRQAAASEHERQSAEALRAESAGDVAAMRVSRARLEQAKAQEELLDFQLARASVSAPFDGVVVEGDLRERIGAPVEKGDLLMKLARVEGMYLVLETPERSIDGLAEGAQGEAAFASQPGRKYKFIVERIEPVARPGQSGNNFSVRCRFEEAPESWWRPGMTGVAKVNAGRRTFLWLLTHRTIDALRLRFW